MGYIFICTMSGEVTKRQGPPATPNFLWYPIRFSFENHPILRNSKYQVYPTFLVNLNIGYTLNTGNTWEKIHLHTLYGTRKHPIEYFTVLPDPNALNTWLFQYQAFFNSPLFQKPTRTRPILKKKLPVGPFWHLANKIAEYLFISCVVARFVDKRSTAAILTERQSKVNRPHLYFNLDPVKAHLPGGPARA